MGILLDRSSLVKIVKMPKAIFIGMFCQYVCMPLVSLYIFFVSFQIK
jgi:predicted Na+-dependent transporter